MKNRIAVVLLATMFLCGCRAAQTNPSQTGPRNTNPSVTSSVPTTATKPTTIPTVPTVPTVPTLPTVPTIPTVPTDPTVPTKPTIPTTPDPPPVLDCPADWDPNSPLTCYPLLFVENGQAYIIGAMTPNNLYTPWDFRYNGEPLEDYFGGAEDVPVFTGILNTSNTLAFYGFTGSTFETGVKEVTARGEFGTGNYWVKAALTQQDCQGVFLGTYRGVNFSPENALYGNRRISADLDSDGSMDYVTWDFSRSQTESAYICSIFIEIGSASYTIQRMSEYFSYAQEETEVWVADIDQDGRFEIVVYEKMEDDYSRGVSIYRLGADGYSEVLSYQIASKP